MIPFLELKKVTAMHGEEIQDAVQRVVSAGWYLQGSENENFCKHYAEYIGTQHCVGCANGLDALILMLQAYKEAGKLHQGDEVIVPANTYIATILAITECGLKPVLVEPDLETLQIDDRLIEQNITNRTKAVMIVHLYGRSAYTERVGEICRNNGLLLFEDNAQAHGCYSTKTNKETGKRQRTGSLGDAAAHSFYPGKNLGALGDGGAVTTNDHEIAEIIRALGNYGSQKKYVFRYQGRNSRLDEVQAAVLDVKLKYLDQDNSHRKEIARYYIENIHNPHIQLPNVSDWDSHVFHLFPILTEKRDALQQYLLSQGVQTQIHYPIPPHKQECYREWNTLSYPLTELIAKQELSLPISPYLTLEEAEQVVKAINEFSN